MQTGGSAAALDLMWERQARWWHVLMAVLLIVTGSGLLLDGARPVTVLVCLGTLGVAYAVWGRTALRTQDPRTATLYLAIAWVAFAAVFWLTEARGESWLLCFAILPQTWAMLTGRRALAVSAAGVVLLGAIVWLQSGRTPEGATSALLSTVIALPLSSLLGLLIDRVFREASERADAIDELHATQARLAASERERGTHAERARLAREIHDTLAQGFTSVLTLARAADAALARGDVATARERLALVQSTAADNLSEARLIVAETTPAHLQSRTLVEALDRLVLTVGAESSMTARLVVEGTPVALGAAADVVILRAVQECLANVRRHAGATRVTVTARYAEDAPTVVEVADDGVGFDPEQDTRGYGLDGVRTRAAEIDAAVLVDTAPERGTRIRLEVPR